MQRVRVKVPKRPLASGNEEEFRRYLKARVRRLRQLNEASRDGRPCKQLEKEKANLRKHWINAGFMDENGNITEQYSDVFLEA